MNRNTLHGRKNPGYRSGAETAGGTNGGPSQAGVRELLQSPMVVFFASPLAIFTLDLEGAVQSWNPAAERIFGWRCEEVLGNPLPVVPQDEEVRYRNNREKRLRGETRAGEEISPRRKDGSRFPALLSMAPLYDEAGRISGSLHIFQALADRRSADIRQHDARTKEVIGQLALGTAHEFNNSVGAIMGWADLALEELPPLSPLRKPLEHILKEARHASDVTRDLLAFAQCQALDMYPVNLNHVVEQAWDSLAGQFPPRILVERTLAPDLGRIYADPEQIERILAELCLYAKDAMPEGGPLRIETGQVCMDAPQCRQMSGRHAGNYAVLSVSHGGTPIGAGSLRHIFEPFFAMPRDEARRGLGLAAVYGIIRQHGGFIHASSEPEYGTRFQVYLPTLP